MSEAEAAAPQAAADAPAPMPAAVGPRRYDISSKERVVDARMPTMDIVNGRFARHLQSGVFTLLRRHADVAASPITVQRHSAFMAGLAPTSRLALASLKPLRGNALVVCDGALLHGLVETMYGGPCRLPAEVPERELSATEQRVFTRLMGVMCHEYRRAWKGIHDFGIEHLRLEPVPQFAGIAGAGEAVVSTTFTLTVGELTGPLHLCLPYSALEPLRDLLYASPLGDADAVDRGWITLLTQQLQSAEVSLVAQLATAELTIEQLLSMQPGDFIELDRAPRIDACVDNVPLFRCHYGTNGGKYALRIDECLTSTGENHGQ
ncbi:MAG: flagellar motor switch protein FliM [Burkholderiaceae bacterium]|nr:flagellar motor switch protein FliM [Burkholderiaceae bacterium]